MSGMMMATAGGGAFQPVTNTYNSGTGATETIPSGGAVQVVITVWGGGAGGGGGDVGGTGGGGGGSGAYVQKTIALVGTDAGKTFTYTVGTAGNAGASSSNGTSGTAHRHAFVRIKRAGCPC
jgi:hypothetical protein